MPDERDAKIQHAIERAWERHGLELRPGQIEYLNRQIEFGSSRYKGDISEDRSLHTVEIKMYGKFYRFGVVYDKNFRCIVTILTFKQVKRTRKRIEDTTK